VGSTSRYGATVQLVADQISEHGGEYNAPAAAARFLSTFGYRCPFVGYVDHPAADALDVIRRRDAEIENSFRGLTDRIPFHSIMVIGPMVQGVASGRDIENARAKLAEGLTEFPDVKLSDAHNRYWSPTGVSDLQLPVLAPVIPVALAESARGSDDATVIRAIRTAAHLTHVDETALAVGDFVSLLLRDLMANGDLESSIRSRMSVLPSELASGVANALDRNWKRTVGAIAGALWGFDGDRGVPSEWIEKVHRIDGLRSAVASFIWRGYSSSTGCTTRVTWLP
jgi:hypothetical protein